MNKLVLIVDDVPAVRVALKNRLEKLGCDVLEAEGPEDARALIAEHRENLAAVILDLCLVSSAEEEGKESGLAVLQECFGPAAPCETCGSPRIKPNVVLLTAYPSVASCRAAFLAGAFDYIDKTSSPDIVIDRVRDAL